MIPMTAPRRRWSFDLRTLFVMVMVLAIPLAWLHRQKQWALARDAFRQNSSDDSYWKSDDFGPPFPLSIFGTRGVSSIWLPGGTSAEEIGRAKELFPESKIFVEAKIVYSPAN